MLSGRNLPAPSIKRQPIIPKSICCSAKSRSDLNVSSATTVSGFKIQTYSPLATLTAWLLAFENPTFDVFSIKVTDGNFSFTMAQLPSLESLSITIISESIPSNAAPTLCRHSSRK